MPALILIRHCASSGQWPDAALTEGGVAAAEALADRLTGLAADALWSSPYRRAIDTLAPFAARAGLAITTDERLKERVLADPEVDDWLDHIRRSFDDLSHRAPGGESLGEVQARALAALSEIASSGGRFPAVASHGNLIASILRAIDLSFGFEAWQALTNPDLFELIFEGGAMVEWRRL